VASHERPGHERPAQLLEDEDRLGHAQPDAAVGLRQAQPEHARLAQLPPPRLVDPAARREGADLGHRELRCEPLADGLPERLLFSRQFEIHQRSLGSPRIRSPTMLRWI
jgi:hypothetical protein